MCRAFWAHHIQYIDFMFGYKKIIFLFLVIFIYAGCISDVDDSPYTEELNEILQRTPFNEKVINNIHLFDSLETILVDNMDVILNDTISQIRLYSRNKGMRGVFSHSIPLTDKSDHIIGAIEKVYTQLMDQEAIVEAIFKRDSTINCITKRDYIHQYPAKYFENLFNRKQKKCLVAKDTLLSNKWYHHITLDRHYGW